MGKIALGLMAAVCVLALTLGCISHCAAQRTQAKVEAVNNVASGVRFIKEKLKERKERKELEKNGD